MVVASGGPSAPQARPPAHHALGLKPVVQSNRRHRLGAVTVKIAGKHDTGCLGHNSSLQRHTSKDTNGDQQSHHGNAVGWAAAVNDPEIEPGPHDAAQHPTYAHEIGARLRRDVLPPLIDGSASPTSRSYWRAPFDAPSRPCADRVSHGAMAARADSVISHLPALLTDLTRHGDDTDPDRFGRLRPSGRYALVPSHRRATLWLLSVMISGEFGRRSVCPFWARPTGTYGRCPMSMSPRVPGHLSPGRAPRAGVPCAAASASEPPRPLPDPLGNSRYRGGRRTALRRARGWGELIRLLSTAATFRISVYQECGYHHYQTCSHSRSYA